MSGTDLAAQVRAARPDLRRSTSRATARKWRLATASTGDEILLAKPFNAAQLLEAVERARTHSR